MQKDYYIRIKKDYAAAVIDDLEKLNAIELIDETADTIPKWHIEMVLIEKKKIAAKPAVLIDWADTIKNICKPKK